MPAADGFHFQYKIPNRQSKINDQCSGNSSGVAPASPLLRDTRTSSLLLDGETSSTEPKAKRRCTTNDGDGAASSSSTAFETDGKRAAFRKKRRLFNAEEELRPGVHVEVEFNGSWLEATVCGPVAAGTKVQFTNDDNDEVICEGELATRVRLLTDKRARPVVRIDDAGAMVRVYCSVAEAMRDLGISRAAVTTSAQSGGAVPIDGYRFRYDDADCGKEGKEDEESSEEDKDSDAEVEASLDGFHPRQLQGMRRGELQHLAMKIGRPADVKDDELRKALIEWWEKRQARLGGGKVQRAALSSSSSTPASAFASGTRVRVIDGGVTGTVRLDGPKPSEPKGFRAAGLALLQPWTKTGMAAPRPDAHHKPALAHLGRDGAAHKGLSKPTRAHGVPHAQVGEGKQLLRLAAKDAAKTDPPAASPRGGDALAEQTAEPPLPLAAAEAEATGAGENEEDEEDDGYEDGYEEGAGEPLACSGQKRSRLSVAVAPAGASPHPGVGDASTELDALARKLEAAEETIAQLRAGAATLSAERDAAIARLRAERDGAVSAAAELRAARDGALAAHAEGLEAWSGERRTLLARIEEAAVVKVEGDAAHAAQLEALASERDAAVEAAADLLQALEAQPEVARELVGPLGA